MTKVSAKNSGGARSAILDAAEELFAQLGFDGVPVREVAKRANVALSLVTYHFPSKEQLIEAVITRRSDALNSARREHLRKFILEDSRDLTKFAEAFTKPFLNLIGSGDEHWRNYGEIIAQTAYSTKYSAALTKHYDQTARMFADTLRDLYGHKDSEKSIRAIVFGIAVMLSLFASTRRVEAISEGKYDSADPNDSYPLMLKFIAGGIDKVMSS
jgi:AcrR family transcriptional regulator